MKLNSVRVKDNVMVSSAIGVVCAVLFGLVLLFLAPIFIINEYVGQSWLGLIAVGVHFIASFLASTACVISRGGGVKSAIIGVLIWFALSMFSGVLLFESSFEHILRTAVACALGCLSGGFVGYLVKKPHNSRGKWKIRR